MAVFKKIGPAKPIVQKLRCFLVSPNLSGRTLTYLTVSPPALVPICGGCREEGQPELIFTMAFQPIVDISSKTIFAYEALVRGPNNETAESILSQVNDLNRYRFDQGCRTRAIELASRLGLAATGADLSINFIPGAVYHPEACLRATLGAASRTQFPLDRLIFEVTEGERVSNPGHLVSIVETYRRHSFRTAIDDFGAGYAGLNLLAKFQPDIIKIDMELTRGVDSRPISQTIVAAVLQVCRALNITVIAEGIETEAEAKTVLDLGIHLMQGYLFAEPGFETLPVPTF
jgi:EAL domain-containing protein (putative c-di-GMP-specific phosphodiesterase class I)